VAALSIRNLDDEVREQLRRRAAAHGRSMEAEVRTILTEAVREPSRGEGLLGAVLDRFSAIDGVELDEPRRAAPPRSPDFSQ